MLQAAQGPPTGRYCCCCHCCSCGGYYCCCYCCCYGPKPAPPAPLPPHHRPHLTPPPPPPHPLLPAQTPGCSGASNLHVLLLQQAQLFRVVRVCACLRVCVHVHACNRAPSVAGCASMHAECRCGQQHTCAHTHAHTHTYTHTPGWKVLGAAWPCLDAATRLATCCASCRGGVPGWAGSPHSSHTAASCETGAGGAQCGVQRATHGRLQPAAAGAGCQGGAGSSHSSHTAASCKWGGTVLGLLWAPAAEGRDADVVDWHRGRALESTARMVTVGHSTLFHGLHAPAQGAAAAGSARP